MEGHFRPQPALKGSPEEVLGGKSGLWSRLPHQRSGCGRSSPHCREREPSPPAYTGIKLGPEIPQKMQIPKVPPPPIELCPFGDQHTAALPEGEQGCVLSRAQNCLRVPLQHIKHFASQGDVAASETCCDTSSKNPVVAQLVTGIRAQPRGDGLLSSCRSAAGLHFSRAQHSSLALSCSGPGESLAARGPAGSSSEAAAGSSNWAFNKTDGAPTGSQSRVALKQNSSELTGSTQREVREMQRDCGFPRVAFCEPLPPGGHRTNQMGDARAAPSTLRQNCPAFLASSGEDGQAGIGGPGPSPAGSAVSAVRGGLPANAPPAERLPSIGGSRVTRSQTAAAALTEVVRIEDSSDEEEGRAVAHKQDVNASEGETHDNAQPTTKAAHARNVFSSLSGLPRGAMEGGTEAATAFLILVAALVWADGHCCVLSAEALNRAAAECAMLKPHQHYRSSNGGVSASTDEANRIAADRREDTGNGVLVLQASPEEGGISLDLWQPLPESAPAAPEAGQKVCSGASHDRPAELTSNDGLVGILCFHKSIISHVRWIRLAAAAAFPDVQKSKLGEERGIDGDYTSCSKTVRCCCCRGGSTGRRSLHAKDKDRKHKRTRITKAQAKHGEEQAGISFHHSSDRRNLQTTVDNSSCHPEKTVPPVLNLLALSSDVAAAPCSPSADATQPINALPREDTLTARSDSTDADENAGPKPTKKRRPITCNKSLSEEPKDWQEALGKRCSGCHHRRQSKGRSTNKPASSTQSKPSHKCRRERKERDSREEGSLWQGITTRGCSSPLQSTGSFLMEKEHMHWIPTPRNALIVTDGKPLLPTCGMAPSLTSTQCDAKRDDAASRGKRDSSSNWPGNSGSADDQDVAREQYLAERPSKFEDILALCPGGSKEKQPRQRREAREHRKEIRPPDAPARESKLHCGHNLSCSKCRKASARHSSSQTDHTVPVLCVELQQSQANRLHCSDLLQKVLEQEWKNSMCCHASSLQEGPHSTGNPHGSLRKAGPQNPAAHTRNSRHGSSHAQSEVNSKSRKSRGNSDSSSSTSSPSINRDSFGGSPSISSSFNSNSNGEMAHGHCHVSRKSLTEGGHGATDGPQSPGTGKRTSRSRSSAHKHERSSSSRRRCRSSSSRRKKARPEVSSTSTVAAMVAGCRKALCQSPVRKSLLQRDNGGDGTTGSSPKQLTQDISRNIAGSVGSFTDGGAHQMLNNKDGSSTEVVRSAPAVGLSMTGEKAALAIKAIDESSPRMPTGDPGKRGPWLLLCIGPALHVAPSEKYTTAGGGNQSCSQLVEAEMVVHDASCSPPGDQGSSKSGAKEEEVPAGCKKDFLSLFEILRPSDIEAGAILDRFRMAGAAGEPADVADLAAFFIGCITEHKDAPAENQENGSKHLPEVVSHVSRVLRRFLVSSLGPWKALCRGKRAVPSFSVERLASSWRARRLRAAVDSSITVGSEDLRNLSLEPAAPLCRAAGDSAGVKGQSPAKPAAAASPPVFDLLLDDRTLRRLSEKEFLDDTIIDFCLGFIVDHILTPEERVRVHISNTFFLSALMEQRCEMEAHSRLTRWLKKELTPLPKKDFIFIPVHHKHQHWSLAVVVYPWRALNPSQANTACGTVRIPSEKSVCKPGTSRPLGGVQQTYPLDVCAHQASSKGSPRSPEAGRVGSSPLGKCRGADAGHAPASLKAPGTHAQRPSCEKARLFHVDSMGLRSVFDRCRGRLKRFLRQEFEHRCGGELKSGERVELCTDSCCWHDGHSCTLHTPRQQNGYDCGVFVVEYVHFLTRNLNAIETLLVGPSRDCQSHRYAQQPAACTMTSSTYGFRGRADTAVEMTRNKGKLLEAALGFHCPCMEAGSPAQMPPDARSAFGLPYNLTARLNELRQAHTALLGSPNTQNSRQRALLLQTGVPLTPLSASQGQSATQELTPQPETGLHGGHHLTGLIRLPDTDGIGESKQRCIMWGPLPLCISKRRSSHTKWFSQDRVTERRSQLHKMLLFMRQNTRWREDPKLIAHLKSLFLNIDVS